MLSIAVSTVVHYFTHGIATALQIAITTPILIVGVRIITKKYGNNAIIPAVVFVVVVSLGGHAIANGTEKMMESLPYLIFVFGVLIVAAVVTRIVLYSMENNNK